MTAATPSIPLPELWAAMLATYGHRWASAYGQDPNGVAAATWAAGLAGLTAGQVAAGLRACLTFGDGWPPTLPEFRALCMGIPALSTVRAEMLRPDAERSPFTRFARALIDGHRYRQADAREADRMLREAYELAREERMRGVALPEAPIAIEDHTQRPPVPADPETAKARMAEIAAILNPPRAPELVAKDEEVMAEFGCSRDQAQAIVDAGTGEAEHADAA